MSTKQTAQMIGIDYGSKLAGTTAICYAEGKNLNIIQSEKKRDADKFILEFCQANNPQLIMLDAPLSLPAAYFDNSSEDYFYRAADRATQAMSPMFIGGLTARAIKLRTQLARPSCKVLETYPKHLVAILNLSTHYKKDLILFKTELQTFIKLQLPDFKNWHQADATLAYCSALRYTNNDCKIIGAEKEGLIYV